MTEVSSRLREVRRSRSLTQQELAAQAGLTRQTIGAIEAGSYGPSLAVGLRIARALGVAVEDLFALPAENPGLAPGPLVRGERVLVARIGEQEVVRRMAELGAYRWPAVAADAVVADEPDDPSLQWLGPDRGQGLFMAGCDPALGLLADHLGQRGLRAHWFSAGTQDAVEQLLAGRAHVAAVHWSAGGAPPQPPEDAERLTFSSWQMGFVLRAADLADFHGPQDLRRPGLRLANREPGAGARGLLDRLLREFGVRPEHLAGYPRAYRGHWEVADAVAQGAADVGVSTGAAAAALGLSFLPLSLEHCEIWWRRGLMPLALADRLGDTLCSAGFRADLAAFGPIDASHTGDRPDAGQRGSA